MLFLLAAGRRLVLPSLARLALPAILLLLRLAWRRGVRSRLGLGPALQPFRSVGTVGAVGKVLMGTGPPGRFAAAAPGGTGSRAFPALRPFGSFGPFATSGTIRTFRSLGTV
jgi:hypothetical protein